MSGKSSEQKALGAAGYDESPFVEWRTGCHMQQAHLRQGQQGGSRLLRGSHSQNALRTGPGSLQAQGVPAGGQQREC